MSGCGPRSRGDGSHSGSAPVSSLRSATVDTLRRQSPVVPIRQPAWRGPARRQHPAPSRLQGRESRAPAQETRQDDAPRQAAVTLCAAGEISGSSGARQSHGAPPRPIPWPNQGVALRPVVGSFRRCDHQWSSWCSAPARYPCFEPPTFARPIWAAGASVTWRGPTLAGCACDRVVAPSHPARSLDGVTYPCGLTDDVGLPLGCR
jgi:hypothetical protein